MDSGGAGRQGIIFVIPSEPGKIQRTLDTCWRGDKESKAITPRSPAAKAAILAALKLRLEYFSEIELNCVTHQLPLQPYSRRNEDKKQDKRGQLMEHNTEGPRTGSDRQNIPSHDSDVSRLQTSAVFTGPAKAAWRDWSGQKDGAGVSACHSAEVKPEDAASMSSSVR